MVHIAMQAKLSRASTLDLDGAGRRRAIRRRPSLARRIWRIFGGQARETRLREVKSVCATNFTTGRASRAVANSFAWRSRKPDDDCRTLARRGKGGIASMMKLLERKSLARPPYAPPFLKAGKDLIGQTALILFYLGPRLGLAPRDEASRLWVHQLQLTITDLVVHIHDTHHPISDWLYYEEQRKPAAKRRNARFLALSRAKILGLFRARAAAQRRQELCGRSAAELASTSRCFRSSKASAMPFLNA